MTGRPNLLIRWIALGAFAGIVLFTGCNGSSGEDTRPAQSQTAKKTASSADASAAASLIFKTRCTTCHGETGHGDGPGSIGLTPQPRSFASAAWQDSVSDEHIEKIIVSGGLAVGKSAAMPGNPDLKAKPDVVKELRAKVRSLRDG